MLKLMTIFFAVLIAEMGDKTQLATLLFASDRSLSPILVFVAASGALVLATGIAVLAGNFASRYLETLPLNLIAGIGFIVIGCWTLFDHFQGT